MTTNQDYFRRSQNQLQALQEILLDQQESICSEGFWPLNLTFDPVKLIWPQLSFQNLTRQLNLNFIRIFSDSIPLVHTPRFRQISPINSDNQSEPKDSTDPNDSNPEEEESSVMPSAPAENEDISDASFRKRHAKPELRERNLVKSDKQHQLELYKRNIRNRKQTIKDNPNQLYR